MPAKSRASGGASGHHESGAYYAGLYLCAIEYIDSLTRSMEMRRQAFLTPNIINEHPFPQDADVAGKTREEMKIWYSRLVAEPGLKRDVAHGSYSSTMNSLFLKLQAILMSLIRNDEYRYFFMLRVDEKEHQAPGYYYRTPAPMHFLAILARIYETRSQLESNTLFLQYDWRDIPQESEGDNSLEASDNGLDGEKIADGRGPSGETPESNREGAETKPPNVTTTVAVTDLFLTYKRADYGDVLMKVELIRKLSLEEIQNVDKKSIIDWCYRIGAMAANKCDEERRPKPYRSAQELLRDLLLIAFNARRYNSLDHFLHKMGGSMLADIRSAWKREFSDMPDCFSHFVSEEAEELLYHMLANAYMSDMLPYAPIEPSKSRRSSGTVPQVSVIHRRPPPPAEAPGEQRPPRTRGSVSSTPVPKPSAECPPKSSGGDGASDSQSFLGIDVDEEHSSQAVSQPLDNDAGERDALLDEIRTMITYIMNNKKSEHEDIVYSEMVNARDVCGFNKTDDLHAVPVERLRLFSNKLMQVIDKYPDYFIRQYGAPDSV
ncbi:Hypothetical protein DHA2_21803 [Giardia duodenalis]|uniref:Bromo domain-containing protein n=1 Tax=Giardia intestinalis TaxID=5741 RepID=V6T9G5_GIAIN|nr:Hypothetical protein DHA2_21803 [Giardia intestinalis]